MAEPIHYEWGEALAICGNLSLWSSEYAEKGTSPFEHLLTRDWNKVTCPDCITKGQPGVRVTFYRPHNSDLSEPVDWQPYPN